VGESRDDPAGTEGQQPVDASPGGLEASPSGPSARPGIEAGGQETELRTFLIADIRGYTTYTREHGDEAAASLASRFGELVAEVVGARDGFLIELRGDEALVVFVSARKALRAAIDLQSRFVEAQLPRGVGIGLDAGEAIPVGEGYRGTALNLAARLCSEAGPGETLASEAVIHLAAKVDGIAYVDARSLRLKGYDDAVRAVVVVAADHARGRRPATGHRSRRIDRRGYAGVGVAIVTVAVAAGIIGGGLLQRGGLTPTTAPGASAGATSSSDVGVAGSPSAPVDPLGGVDLPVLAFFDAKTGALDDTTPISLPTNISFFDDDSFWVLGYNPSAFYRIDSTHQIVQSIAVPSVEARGYALGEGGIWIADAAGARALRIDQRTGVTSTYPIGADPSDSVPAFDVTIGGGSVWLARPEAQEIVRLDADDGRVEERIPDVDAYGVIFGEGALWYTTGDGRLGRIDATTNRVTFDPVLLAPTGILGNTAVGGGDAWAIESDSGHVWRVDRAGRATSFSLAPGIGEMRATDDTMWVTNADTGKLTGIDLVTGTQGRPIDTGHAILAVATGGDEIMVAVGPTVDEVIAGLDGSVLKLAVSDSPWTDPSPDPALNGDPRVQQMFYLTCAALLNYPDEPAPGGWVLEPEVAAAMPTISADGTTYTFTIRPGFQFSPPSDEEVTAETFRATIERALSPVLDDDAPGPRLLGDIVGVGEYRSGAAAHISGLVASGDRLVITLEAPSPDLLQRLASPYVCPVPLGTPMLRSGLDPDPPISGTGPYYLLTAGRHSVVASRLVILKKNPNYHGPRPQPFDYIAIRTRSSTATSINKVRDGTLDAAILRGDEAVSSSSGAIASQWGPESPNAAAGRQRWFGAPRRYTGFLALNPSRPAFRDPDVRSAVSLALDRAAIGDAWIISPSADLLSPAVPGSASEDAPAPPANLDAARALMRGRTLEVTMLGFPPAWDCGQCRDFEDTIVGQLETIGITVEVRHPDSDEYPGDAFDPGSTIDLLDWGSGAELPDPVAFLGDLHDVSWIGEANLTELDRLQSLRGQARIDAAVAFAHRLADEESLIVPYGYPIDPFFMSEQIGCAFVQPAIGAVDLLTLCREP